MNKTQKWFALAATFVFISLTFLPIVQGENLPRNSKTMQKVILKEELQKNLESKQSVSTEIIGKSGRPPTPPTRLLSLFVWFYFMVPALLSLLPYALEDILEDLLE